jgi:hypothetical protein
MAGGSMRGLRFLLGFSVEILREGDDGRPTEDSLWTLVEDLMTALKSNPTLGGVIRNVGTVTGRQANGPLRIFGRPGSPGRSSASRTSTSDPVHPERS